MGSCWWTVVAGCYFRGDGFTEEVESGVWVARAGT